MGREDLPSTHDAESTAGGRPEGTTVRRPLTSENVVDYLRERRLLATGAQAHASELSGGISNRVIHVEAVGVDLVVKQSLSRLRVQEIWEFDPRRILAECRCMQALTELLPGGSVPEVVDVDEQRLAFTMTYAPPGGVVWKDALLQGDVNPAVARQAGALLGQIHQASGARLELAGQFDDLMPLIQGRIDPYHRTAVCANPDLAALIEADVERLLTRRRALVLGDYSPKNLIVYPDRVLALDFEVAHWGDPAFDTAFMLTHLIAKAVHLPDHGDEFVAAAQEFWAAYRGQAGSDGADPGDTATECGVLLLCRVDGKSRLEYLTGGERTLIRRLARDEICSDRHEIDRMLDAVTREVAKRRGQTEADMARDDQVGARG
jgi:aminoglycoside phosphotransferase (APT) family kinase protein